MHRRDFIRSACLIGAALSAPPSMAQSLLHGAIDQGVENPCLSGLPDELARHEVVQAAFHGVAADEIWDAHAHLVAVGDGASGGYLNPQMNSPLHFRQFVQ